MDAGWEDKVRVRAYALWEGEGPPEGGAERHWAEAEEELKALLLEIRRPWWRRLIA